MADSIHESLLDAMVARIQGLNLPDMPDGHVVWRLVMNETATSNLSFPAVVVFGDGDEEPLESGQLSGSDDTLMPLVVRILHRDVPLSTALQAKFLLWRQMIRRAFRNQRLQAESSNWLLVWKGGKVAEDWGKAYRLIGSELIYEAKVAEPRVTV